MANLIELAAKDPNRAKKRLNAIRNEERFRGLVEGAVAMLTEGDLAVELGANTGELTEKLVASGATVVAYEPDPVALAALRINLKGADNLEIVDAAAALTDDEGKLLRGPKFTQTISKSTAPSTMMEVMREKDYGNVETVKKRNIVEHLKELIKENDNIDFLFMDITGSELEIIEQMMVDELFDNIKFSIIVSYQRDFRSLNERFRKMRSNLDANENWNVVVRKL